MLILTGMVIVLLNAEKHNQKVKHMASESVEHGVQVKWGESLSGMQARVMELLAGGLGRKEISETLNISLHTVNTHVERIYKKLGVHNAVSAAGAAMRKNLLREKRQDKHCAVGACQ